MPCKTYVTFVCSIVAMRQKGHLSVSTPCRTGKYYLGCWIIAGRLQGGHPFECDYVRLGYFGNAGRRLLSDVGVKTTN
jgi:hypothetical protein